MYIPYTTNIPLLKDKGEAQVELTASTNSLHLSGDYAFSKRYALMINGGLSYKNFTNRYDIFTNNTPHESSSEVMSVDLSDWGEFAHKYGEIGLGRYNILLRKMKLEVFGGVGYGIATDNASSSIGSLNYDANYYLGFAQINFGKTRNKFDFGWALRLASTFYDYTYQIDPSSDYPEHNNGLPQNTTFSMIHVEPLAFLRFGSEKIKFVGQLGIALSKPIHSLGDLDVNRGIYNGYVKTTNFHITIGVNFKFGQKAE
jgi:hypothetical protein